MCRSGRLVWLVYCAAEPLKYCAKSLILRGNAADALQYFPRQTSDVRGVAIGSPGLMRMHGGDDDTEEPQLANFDGAGGHAPEPKMRRRSFGKVRRELTEDELDSSGVQKMLLDELDRLEGAEIDLKSTSEKFHETNTKLEVAKEKLKIHNGFDLISTGTVAVGSVLFGAAFNWKDDHTLFYLLIILGVVLIAVGIAAKRFRA